MTFLHENAIKLGLLESYNWMLYKGGHSPEKANGELDLVETNTIYFVGHHIIWSFVMFEWSNGISEIFEIPRSTTAYRSEIPSIFEEITKFWPKICNGWQLDFLIFSF